MRADPSGRVLALISEVAGRSPELDVVDDDGTRHRLWSVPVAAVPSAGPDAAEHVADAAQAPVRQHVREPALDVALELSALAGAGPITIADGHHRYETALRYRDERRQVRSAEEDPAYDYLLMLLLETASQPLTVLPTHRVVRGLGETGVEHLLTNLGELFDVQPADPSTVAAPFGGGGAGIGGGSTGSS